MPPCRMSESRSVKLCELKIFLRPSHAHHVRRCWSKIRCSRRECCRLRRPGAPCRHRCSRPSCPASPSHRPTSEKTRCVHHGIAAAQPIHAILVGVVRVAADHAQIVVAESGRILHLDRPGARADDAGEPVDLHVVRLVGPDAVPVGLLHPAFVGVGVLRAVVDDRSPAQHFHVLHLPQIQAAEDDTRPARGKWCRRSSDSGFRDARPPARWSRSDPWAQAEAARRQRQKASAPDSESRRAARWKAWRGRADESGWSGLVGGTRGRRPSRHGSISTPRSQKPVGRSDRNLDRPGGVEAHEFVVRGGLSHVNALVVHRDGKEAVSHLRRDRRGLDVRSGAGDARKREN